MIGSSLCSLVLQQSFGNWGRGHRTEQANFSHSSAIDLLLDPSARPFVRPWIIRHRSLACQHREIRTLFCVCDRCCEQRTVMPVGTCFTRTAVSTLLTFCPPVHTQGLNTLLRKGNWPHSIGRVHDLGAA